MKKERKKKKKKKKKEEEAKTLTNKREIKSRKNQLQKKYY